MQVPGFLLGRALRVNRAMIWVGRTVAIALMTASCALAAGTPSTPIGVPGTSFSNSPTISGSPARSPDASATAGASSPRGAVRRWITGYYAGYERDLYPVAEIDWGSLTDLAVAFILPQPNGSLDMSLYADESEGLALADALVDAAHRHDRFVIASIGGAGMRTAWLSAASTPNRSRFVANLVRLVTDEGYDGLDLDWEPLEEGDGTILLDLLGALRSALPDALLTMPIDPVNTNLPQDLSIYADLAMELDRLNLMSYGMAGAYEGWSSWHSSALMGDQSSTPTSVASSVRAYVAAGVPAARLGVGAGFYGLCYSPPVSGPGQALRGATIVADDGVMSYAHIVRSYANGATSRWDDAASVPYLSFADATGPEGCGYISYENERSVLAKTAYLASEGFGGVIIWTINQGYIADAAPARRNPLLAALASSP